MATGYGTPNPGYEITTGGLRYLDPQGDVGLAEQIAAAQRTAPSLPIMGRPTINTAEQLSPSMWSRFKTMFGDERGAIGGGSRGLYTPPTYGSGPTSMGTLAEMQQAATSAAAQQATQSQASQLLNARLAPYNQQMQALGEQLGPMQQLNQVAGVPNPETVAATQRLAGMSPAAEQAVAGAAAPLEGAAASSPGMLSRALGATGYPAAMANGGGLGGAFGLAKARIGPALAFSVGGQLAAPVVGAGVDQIVPGTGGAAGDAVKSMGNAAGLGFMVGGPVGGLIGEGVGGVGAISHGISELQSANTYDDTAGQFQKLINSKGISGTDQGDAFVAAAHAIHNGQDVVVPINGQNVAINGSQATSIDQKNALLGALNGQMQTYKTSLTQSSRTPATEQTPLAIQMGQAMAALSQDYVNQGTGQANMIRGMEAALPAQYKPLLEADAASREAYAHQMGDAFQAAAYMTPQINQMDAQLAYQQQLLSQIRAAQTSSASGSGSLSSALQGGVANAQNAQALANNNSATMQQLNVMAAPSLGG